MVGWQQRRVELETLVERALAGAEGGFLRNITETAEFDVKEEAGRRTRSGGLEPGTPENPEAATKLADEVACFANTPGGGVLLVGVDDGTTEILGTELDVEWLRHRIYRAVDVAPDVVEYHAGGQRLLALYVSEALEPVENTRGAVRWRVGDHCVPVDRAAWWEYRRRRAGVDPLAEPSSRTVADIPRSTLERVRRLLGADPTEPDRAMLHRIGAVDADGRLSGAAELLLCPPGRVLLDLTLLDVEGGEVLNHVQPEDHLSLLDQIDVIEKACAVVDTGVDLGSGFAHESVRRVPLSAVREAILNGIIHRDWDTRRPTEVRWIEIDSTLTVRSPGGFVGGVTEQNVLTHRHPRHPAFADLFRVLGLVEKQGLGIDRMFTAMITLGHRPPRIVQTAGPYVVCELAGGRPHLPVLELIRRIRPEARQRDVRIVLLVHVLLHRPFLTEEEAARVLQTDVISARSAFDAARQTTVDAAPILRRHRDVWALGPAAFAYAQKARYEERVMPVMSYAGTSGVGAVIDAWLAEHSSITSADLMELTGVSRATAQRALGDDPALRKEGGGRSTHYLRR